MGELSRADACAKREKYKQVFTEIMEMADKEFSDMDYGDQNSMQQENQRTRQFFV